MSYLSRFSPLPLFALAAVLGITGCPQSQNDSAANTNQASAQDQGTDPAAANLALLQTIRMQLPTTPRRQRVLRTSRALLRPVRAAPTIRRPTRDPTIPATASSRWRTLPTHRRRCPTTTSLRLPATTISGRPVTGAILRRATIGCPASGLRLLTRALSGPLGTGAIAITATGSIAAIGVPTSATMAASTTVSATSASATRAAIGVAATSTTTARPTTSMSPWYTTSITGRWAIIVAAALVSASTAARAECRCAPGPRKSPPSMSSTPRRCGPRFRTST